MKIFQFESLYTEQGWLDNAYVCLNDDGSLLSISQTASQAEYPIERVDGWTIPGFINGHSHAFQYAMAGTAEYLPAQASKDDFWSWREAMYRTALGVDPDEMEAIATSLYTEMLRQGYTSVVEFHYLHHDKNGEPYTNKAEMAARHIQAAKKTGIAITLVPILYQQYDLEKASTPEQRRFLSKTVDEFWQLYEATYAECRNYQRANIGFGVHSIRAVPPEVIRELLNSIHYQIPIHLHMAEQIREVEQCQAVLGKRPVEWLLDNLHVDKRYHLVHATHMTAEEARALARSKANVVLCPSTEGNLGDGFFSLLEFMQQDGLFSIGSDSQIGLSPFEELRWLDYVQRLRHQQRNVVCLNQANNSGELLFRKTHYAGQLAMGQWQTALFAPQQAFDCLVIDTNHPRLAYTDKTNRLATLIYCCDRSVIRKVMTSGQWVIN